MKILILRFSSIGDVVLTTPVIRSLKTQLEDAQVHFAIKAEYEAVLAANPFIDKLHLLKNDLSDLIRELRQEKFDCIVDLHHNLRTFRIKQALGIKSYAYNKLNIEKWLMVNFKINKLPNKHIVDRYMEAVSPLGIKMDASGLDYFIPDKDDVPLEWLPEEFRGDYVVYAIGAQHATKRLPLNRMIELCDKINGHIILLGGKEDIETGEAIVRFFAKEGMNTSDEKVLFQLNKKTVVFNACGKFNINQSASIVKKSSCVFTHDTGLMHIAAAFKKEVYSIWGNTLPAFGMYPYRTKFTVLENTHLGCRPCSKIGFDRCPKGHFKCMNEIVFDFYRG